MLAFFRLCLVLYAITLGLPAKAQSLWSPAPGQSWDWQLSAPFDFTRPVDILDIDQQETSAQTVAMLHGQGKHVICYISVGSWESWRPDASAYPAALKGKDYDGWEGEKWVDIRRLDLLGPILQARFDDCAAKGFDAIEPDNIDGFENDTGFALTADDQLVFNRWLANEAHSRGLSIGLKNDNGQVADLLNDFDWALSEDCDAQNWCADLEPFIAAGKAVLQAEYTDTGASLGTFCTAAKARGFSGLLKQRNLQDWARFCPQDSPLAASILPSARSTRAGEPVTVFATLINASATDSANGCTIAAPAGFPATLQFQTTDAATNTLTGTPDTPVDIAPGAAQTFLISVTPTTDLSKSTDMYVRFACTNTAPAASYLGTNTLHLAPAAPTGSADIIAIVATTSHDGTVHLPSASGQHFFTASAINIDQSSTITARIDDDGAGLPLTITLCQTNAQSACLATPAGSITTNMAHNETVFYAVFITATGAIPFNPALNRLTLRLEDSAGTLRGATSIAVRTP
ncbi:MAG: endo alpha-1,4 polygalactosaminidase [Robiginitomaculum sp.]|nr:endo alpha-1,4 polygalactosaminidase [Robiginitomaculum sp.]MDQ7077461.1 endo alpha-1,4 polygalactosaminidase [Robiginitomaculum sp.]